jgi:hypothetical protein
MECSIKLLPTLPIDVKPRDFLIAMASFSSGGKASRNAEDWSWGHAYNDDLQS